MGGAASAASRANQNIQEAVLGYVRAVRAAGRENVSIPEIATALAITQSAIVTALAALHARGIRVPTL